MKKSIGFRLQHIILILPVVFLSACPADITKDENVKFLELLPTYRNNYCSQLPKEYLPLTVNGRTPRTSRRPESPTI